MINKIAIIFLLAFSSISCKTIAKRFELIEGTMTEVERMEIDGAGKNKADFKSHKIENDSGFKVPDIDLDIDELSD